MSILQPMPWSCRSTKRARSGHSTGPSRGLPIKLGRCQTLTHDYKRHGTTTTLFAALSVLAGTVIDRSTRTVITAEYKVNLVSPSLGDRLTCRAEVVKPGRSLTVVDAKVYCRTEGAEKLVAVALATIANLDRKPGNEA